MTRAEQLAIHAWTESNYRSRHAADTCATCPVRTECETWAASEKYFDGIAGGFEWRDNVNGGNRTKRRVLNSATVEAAAVAYRQGYRAGWVVDGHREWDRDRKRRARA